MPTIDFTEGELFELGDVVSPALLRMIEKKDPENHEAKYGTASNLLSILRKIGEAKRPGEAPPDWMAGLESDVAALRAAKSLDPKAAKAVAEFKASETMMVGSLKFKIDEQADKDGIRNFTISDNHD